MFRSTVFATGLDFPYGMQQLDDGSLLVGVSRPLPGGSYFQSVGELIRLHDRDGDGRADGFPTVLYSGLPGVVTAVRRVGGLVFVTSAESGRERISVLFENPNKFAPYSLAGVINFAFPPGWEHVTYALDVRRVGREHYEVFFNIGSSGNDSQSSDTVLATGLVEGVLEGASVYRFTVRHKNRSVSASGLTRIASGLRNAAGIGVEPETGDLYFQDNGIDNPAQRSDQISADELNRIPAADLGGAVDSFGFPGSYVAYRSGEFVGGQGLSPVCAFQPLGDPPSESEGASDIAFVPGNFPPMMRSGVFVGFFGEYGKSGLANGENPVVFCDRATGQYYHFISNDEPRVAHLTGLLSTRDSLFLADLSHTATLGGGGAGTGVIYQIQAHKRPVQRIPPGKQDR
ncbi:MAG: hypothetical protein M3374_05950 [Pseudomonadota bacterium]|nr:hypothetical protein [Pseudomonadota bacterium]